VGKNIYSDRAFENNPGSLLMPQYLLCSQHSFSSVDDLKKHLEIDVKDFMAIMPDMKAAGMTRTERGIRVDADGKFTHQGFLWFRDKAAYEAGMSIIDAAKWDDEIPRKNRFETYVVSDEISASDLQDLDALADQYR
jgi:hypothetical protein